MKAALMHAFAEPLLVQRVDDPAPDPHGVVVAVRANGISRSDWHGWMGHDSDIRLPHVPGHELAGGVAEVGSAVRRWKAGDRVTVPFAIGCGRCAQCQAGQLHICDDYYQPGFTGWGSFAQLVAIPHADLNLVALPPELSDVAAASLGCRLITAFRAVVTQGRAHSGEWVVVHGCGGVGLAAVMVAHAIGARAIGIDVKPDALTLATAETRSIPSGPTSAGSSPRSRSKDSSRRNRRSNFAFAASRHFSASRRRFRARLAIVKRRSPSSSAMRSRSSVSTASRSSPHSSSTFSMTSSARIQSNPTRDAFFPSRSDLSSAGSARGTPSRTEGAGEDPGAAFSAFLISSHRLRTASESSSESAPKTWGCRRIIFAPIPRTTSKASKCPPSFASRLRKTTCCCRERSRAILMGVGTPENILEAIERGIDMFDCVLPTRNGRNGMVFTSRGTLNLRNAAYKTDFSPFDPSCECYACRTFSRAYVRHLVMSKEILALQLATIHNIHFFITLVRTARNAILEGRYGPWKQSFLGSLAAAATEVLYATTPVLVMVLSGFLLKETITLRKGAGIFLAFGGVAIVIFERGLDFSAGTTYGNIIIFVGVIAWAFFARQGRLEESADKGEI